MKVINYCDPDFQAAFDHALELQTKEHGRRVYRVGRTTPSRGRPRPHGTPLQRRRPVRVGAGRQLPIQSRVRRPVRPDVGPVGRGGLQSRQGRHVTLARPWYVKGGPRLPAHALVASRPAEAATEYEGKRRMPGRAVSLIAAVALAGVLVLGAARPEAAAAATPEPATGSSDNTLRGANAGWQLHGGRLGSLPRPRSRTTARPSMASCAFHARRSAHPHSRGWYSWQPALARST